jgi:hypothetical protein
MEGCGKARRGPRQDKANFEVRQGEGRSKARQVIAKARQGKARVDARQGDSRGKATAEER